MWNLSFDVFEMFRITFKWNIKSVPILVLFLKMFLKFKSFKILMLMFFGRQTFYISTQLMKLANFIFRSVEDDH